MLLSSFPSIYFCTCVTDFLKQFSSVVKKVFSKRHITTFLEIVTLKFMGRF